MPNSVTGFVKINECTPETLGQLRNESQNGLFYLVILSPWPLIFRLMKLISHFRAPVVKVQRKSINISRKQNVTIHAETDAHTHTRTDWPKTLIPQSVMADAWNIETAVKILSLSAIELEKWRIFVSETVGLIFDAKVIPISAVNPMGMMGSVAANVLINRLSLFNKHNRCA